MEKKRKISQYREKLDKTLASPELTNQETLKTLIKNQILCSSQHGNEECTEDLLDKRTIEVSNFLDELRSASVKDHEVSRSSEAAHGDWKLKHDNEDFRVMYREGAQGTPFHTLLVEGYVDGPVDACLCIGWESSLYKKWWPQTVFPSFRVTNCKCLQKVRIGEHISIVRMKVPWPMTDREAVVHYFLFQYFQDDLIVVLLNSISDIESIDNGFTKNGIPEAHDAVMIDLVGGYALQKVTAKRSYFRTIASLDIKLDFLPPSLINFISRQLIGNGFRLYQKAVVSVSKSEEDYSTALRDSLYTQIREALYSTRKLDEACKENELKSNECVIPKQGLVQDMKDEECTKDTEQKLHGDEPASESSQKNEPEEECTKDILQQLRSGEHTSESSPKNEPITLRKAFGEIEEEDGEESAIPMEEDLKGNAIMAKGYQNCDRRVCISPEVKQALGTLEKVISIVRKYRLNVQDRAMSSSSLSDEELPPASTKDPVKDQTSSENIGIVSSCKVSIEIPKKEFVERTSQESRSSSGIHSIRRVGSSSFPTEGNHNRIAPASPEQDLPTSAITSITGTLEVIFLGQTTKGNKQTRNQTYEINRINGLNEGKKSTQRRKHRLCCFGFNSR